ncbi:AAA family ATPase [Actinokineospora guangxiensis]|uniref:AAA family ATPase n=1 Tax=Actinokineospora guangxiensis TaxID=1490288 RepID=A0ABW0EW60_9PSEU
MLVERDAALSAARAALEAAAGGRGGLLVITGSPGAGRSALLGAVAELAERGDRTVRVLRADATQAERDFDFGVVQQLFRPLVAAATDAERERWFSGGAAALVRPLLVDAPGPAGLARAADAALPGLHALVAALAADRPVLIAVDDLQWTDRPSLRWLAYLARRVAGSRVLVVATVADGYSVAEPALVEEVTTSAAHLVPAAVLTPAGTHAVVVAKYAEPPEPACPVDPAFSAALHEVTAGNPAALMSVLHGLRGRGLALVADAAETVRADSHGLLLARRLYYLDNQPAAVIGVARAIVVLGEAADPELVTEVAGLDLLDYKHALLALDRLGLLASVEPPRLVRGGVRVAVETSTPVEERDRLHRQAALALHDAGRSAGEVADQLLMVTSGYQHWETDQLRSAAEEAAAEGAADRAVRYLRRALLAGPADGPDRARLLVDLAVAERGVDPVAAIGHIAQALPDLPTGPDHAGALLAVPFPLTMRSPSVSALLRAGASGPDPVLVSGYPEMVLRLEARGRALDDHDPVPLADAVARLRGFDEQPLDSAGGRELLAVLAHAAAVSAGLPAAEVAGLGRALLAREEPAVTHAHTAFPVVVTAVVAAGAASTAEPWLERWGRAAQRHDSVGQRAVVNAARAVVAAGTGAIGKARTLAASALDVAGSVWPAAAISARMVLAGIAVQTNDTDLAHRVLRHDLDAPDPRVALASLTARALLDVGRGDHVAALDKFLVCGDRAVRYGWANPAVVGWRVHAAVLHKRLGDVDAALALAEREHAAAVAWGTPAVVGRALRLRGMLGEGDEALSALRAAVESLRRGEDRVELSRALLLLGRALARAGDPESIVVLAESDRLIAECGASWAAGDRDGEWAGPVLVIDSGGIAELTKAEQNVVALVVRGWTNQRIADSLGITRRAVEKSLTGTYRKLGVPNRAALVEQWKALAPDEDDAAR